MIYIYISLAMLVDIAHTVISVFASHIDTLLKISHGLAMTLRDPKAFLEESYEDICTSV
jgi:hypothetical protein